MQKGTEPKTYLVLVTPLSKSPIHGTLSYFSATKLLPGTLVRVLIKSKLVPVLVLTSKDVRYAKSEIRRSGFALKKIKKSDILETGIESSFLSALEDTARYYVTPIGTILRALLPDLVVSDPTFFLHTSVNNNKKKLGNPKEVFLLQMESGERMSQYRALIPEAPTKKPTREEVEAWGREFEASAVMIKIPPS